MIAGPEDILSQITIPAGGQIADIGAGTGHYAVLVADKIKNSQGKVFAIDIQKELLDKLHYEAVQRGLDNVHIVWGDAEKPKGTRLRDDSIDLVLITNTLFQIENKDNFLQEISRILKRGGSVVFVDWTDSFGGLGPREDHILSPETARALFTENGFVVEKDLDTGEHHYGFVALRV